MTTTVLAYIPSPAQGVWYLGPVPIRAYALCIIAGIIAALVIGDRRWAARGGERGVVYDVALWAVPFGLIGGRIYHLLTDWKTYFGPGGAGIGAAIRIWEGGLGIWGAVLFGGVGAWIACRRRGIPLPAFGDAVAPGIVLAQAIGRLGNYFNQELYGRETTVPWGMEIFYRRDSSGVVDVHSLDGVSTGQVAAVVHPTFLYEMLWNLLVFVLLLWADRKFRLGHGRLFALYVAAYCVGRFWVELMRDDTATHIAGIRINVFTATFVFIGAVVYMLLAPKGRENPASLRGNQPLEAHDESRVEEWAEDLVAVGTSGGIIAAVKVAGEHDEEDAEAVGDVDDSDTDDTGDTGDTDDTGETDDTGDTDEADAVEETAVEETAVDETAVDEIIAADDVVVDEDDVVVEEVVVEDVEETDVEVGETADDVDEDIDDEADSAEDSDDAVVVIEESEGEPETVVVYESENDRAEALEDEAEQPEAEAESEPEADAEAEAEVEAKVEVEVEEPAAAPATELASQPVPDEEPAKLDDEPVKLKGSTLKRLLWGAGRN